VRSRHSALSQDLKDGLREGQIDLEAWKGLNLAVGCIFISKENEPMGK